MCVCVPPLQLYLLKNRKQKKKNKKNKIECTEISKMKKKKTNDVTGVRLTVCLRLFVCLFLFRLLAWLFLFFFLKASLLEAKKKKKNRKVFFNLGGRSELNNKHLSRLLKKRGGGRCTKSGFSKVGA